MKLKDSSHVRLKKYDVEFECDFKIEFMEGSNLNQSAKTSLLYWVKAFLPKQGLNYIVIWLIIVLLKSQSFFKLFNMCVGGGGGSVKSHKV